MIMEVMDGKHGASKAVSAMEAAHDEKAIEVVDAREAVDVAPETTGTTHARKGDTGVSGRDSTGSGSSVGYYSRGSREELEASPAEGDRRHLDATKVSPHVAADANATTSTKGPERHDRTARPLRCTSYDVYRGACLGLAVLATLYFFFISLSMLSAASKVLTGASAGSLLGEASHPIAAVMVGTLATALIQSSSTTTSVTVALVAAGAIELNIAVFLIFGANIGTSITSTIAAVGHINHRENFERAFAGATVHDVFNLLTVVVFLPLEVATGVLRNAAVAIVGAIEGADVKTFKSPLKAATKPIADAIIKADSDSIEAAARGEEHGSFVKGGVLNIDGWSDTAVGGLAFGVSFFCVVAALFMLVKLLKRLVSISKTMALAREAAEAQERAPGRAKRMNSAVAVLVGIGITIAVQSSSVTTATLTPLVGNGVVALESVFPLAVGANIGTTVTALMAAIASGSTDALAVSLVHVLFNFTGALVWYASPLRVVPLAIARRLGYLAGLWAGFALVYLAVVFGVVPLMLLEASQLLTAKPGESLDPIAAFAGIAQILLMVFVVAGGLYWWYRDNGKGRQQTEAFFAARRQRAAERAAPADEDPESGGIAPARAWERGTPTPTVVEVTS